MNTTRQSNSWKQIFLFSIFIILAAQINIDVFTSNFRVSIGILLFPVLVFLYESIPFIPVALCSAVGVFLSRVIMLSFRNGFSASFIAYSFPECIFYLLYSLMVFLYFKRYKQLEDSPFSYLLFFCMDYLANLCELIIRLQTDAFTVQLQTSILFVALLRTIMLWAVISGLGHYKFLLLNKEHFERYRNLLLLISKLNGEIIFMKKNTTLIEETMQTSYKLFEKLKDCGDHPELTSSALSVAKDIHEIKKEYMLILRGISDALEINLQDDGMKLSSILLILQNSFSAEKKQVQFHLDVPHDFYTEKHYFLLSIFRNLFNNAVEASVKDSVTLTFHEIWTKTDCIFEITDDGPGIAPENMADIFVPGFSTKINFHTGEISRGLGLNLVKDLIENQFNGSIEATSVPGQTTFRITIPQKYLGGY